MIELLKLIRENLSIWPLRAMTSLLEYLWVLLSSTGATMTSLFPVRPRRAISGTMAIILIVVILVAGGALIYFIVTSGAGTTTTTGPYPG